MHKIIVALAGILLVWSGMTGIVAQEDEPTSPFYDVIGLYIDIRLNDSQDAVEPFINQLEMALMGAMDDDLPYSLVIGSTEHFAQITVNIDVLPDQDLLFVDMPFVVLPDPAMMPSHVVVPHIYTEFPLAMSPSNPDWVPITVDLVLGMSAYINNDCERALPLLRRSAQGIADLEQTVFVGQAEQAEAYVMFYEATCALADDDYEQAQRIYQDTLALYEEEGFDVLFYGLETRLNLAWATYELGDMDAALALIDEANSSQFDWVVYDANLMESEIWRFEGDYERALALLEDIRGTYDDDPLLLLDIAYLRILTGDFKGAEQDLIDAEKDLPGDPLVTFTWGLFYYEQGLFADAEPYLRDYLSVTPDGFYAEDAQAMLDELG